MVVLGTTAVVVAIMASAAVHLLRDLGFAWAPIGRPLDIPVIRLGLGGGLVFVFVGYLTATHDAFIPASWRR